MPGTEITISPARDLAPAATGDEVQRLAAAVAEYADAALAASTRRAYESGWRHFVNWCAQARLAELPADPRTVAAYLAAYADRLTVATLSQRLAAIRWKHLAEDLAEPDSAILRDVWAGIRHMRGRPPNKKRAMIVADLRKVLQRMPATTAGLRDRALILVTFAGAFRRSEISGLMLEDRKSLSGGARLRFVAGGAEILLPRSKTDQSGRGRTVAIPHGKTKLCAIAALKTWLEHAGISSGPVFRPVDRHQRIAARAISPAVVADVVKRSAERAGLDPEVFAGHSLRSGFITQAAANGAEIDLIMRQSGHVKTDTVMGYIRDAELFTRNAASKVGL